MRSFEIVVALGVVWPLAALGAEEPPLPPRTFTVATFNINWGNPNLSEIVQVIARSQADLVALQETNRVSARFLRQRLGREYADIVFTQPRDPRRRGLAVSAGGFGFLSKVPLRKVRYLKAKDGMFGTYFCEVTLGGRTLQIVNVHLQPFLLQTNRATGNRGLGDMLRMIGQVEHVHAKEIARIGEQLPKDASVILLGDLNSPATMAAPQFLLKRGFVDSFASVTKDPERHPTWCWPTGDVTPSFRVDYIFHKEGISTVESRVLKTDASDHALVVSKLEVPAEPAVRQPPGQQ